MKILKHLEKWPFHYQYSRNYYDDNLNYIGHYIIEESSDSTVCLRSFYVDEEYRNMGYGKEIFSNFMEEILEKYDVVYLTVKKDNLIAIKMYEKAGFKFDSKCDQLHNFMKLELKKIELKDYY